MNTRFIIIFVLQLFCALSFAGDVGPAKEDNSIRVYIPDLKPGFEFTASATYLQPHADNLGWAVITTVLPIPSPNWQVETIDPEYQMGFNLGARYVFSNPGTDVQLNWSHLDSQDRDGVIVNPTSQWVSPFSQTGTPPTATGQITGVSLLKIADTQLNFNYDSVNLDMGKFINFGSNLQSRLFTGISSVFIKERLISTFRGLPLPIFVFNNTTSYKGIGPRLGLNNNYEFYRGIHLIGQFAGSLLYGRMQPAQYQFTGTSKELIAAQIYVNQEGLANPTVNQLVTALDAKLGLSYRYLYNQKTELTFEAGYMGALYINPLSSYETNTNVIAIDSGSLSTSSAKHTQSNFSVGGPYVSINVRC
ncbi:major outer membrane protein [Legionella moravica]|uniref:Major outer membrane protein n=1 Tax=Legionella moravica TaxID=39962 RepID=A0A378JSW9_9GAMM|nr:Lpg1974 family pore-forming outer membrane protein [Legionella moravica]KTD39062.1 major outer membrane protein [Legionella moravica]STX61140.1 major outer membrane protein [Legionella moravica]